MSSAIFHQKRSQGYESVSGDSNENLKALGRIRYRMRLFTMLRSLDLLCKCIIYTVQKPLGEIFAY